MSIGSLLNEQQRDEVKALVQGMRDNFARLLEIIEGAAVGVEDPEALQQVMQVRAVIMAINSVSPV